MQSILLVSKLLKQFRYLTIRARQGRFWAIYVPFPIALAADVDCPRSTPIKIESRGLDFLFLVMETESSGLDFLCGSTTTLWHVDVNRLNSRRFLPTEIDSTGLDFLLMATTPPCVACGSQLGPFFPLYSSHSVSSARLSHSSAHTLFSLSLKTFPNSHTIILTTLSHR